mmetsp:Transcript_4523/g.11370  ORF Transcript_4523/g.11370 Transcript_4523/m.11370 type:complete len:479 (+) Transcript_4523:121-1557(+)
MPVLLSWSAKVQILKDYHAKHGHCKVPQKYRDPKSGFSLGKWVSNVRRTRSELHPWQIKQLYQDGMEFCWNVHRTTWDTWFQLLLDYQKEKHHVNPSADEEFRGKKIGGWVVQQQKLYARTILEVGTNKTESDENEEDTKTSSSKRRKAGSLGTTLSQDRIDRLNEIGFDWKAPSIVHQRKPDIRRILKVPRPTQANEDSSSSSGSSASLGHQEEADEASLSSSSSTAQGSAVSSEGALAAAPPSVPVRKPSGSDFLFFVQNNDQRRQAKSPRSSRSLPLRKRKSQEEEEKEQHANLEAEHRLAKRAKIVASMLPKSNPLAIHSGKSNVMQMGASTLDNLMLSPHSHPAFLSAYPSALLRAQQQRQDHMLRLNELILQQELAETRIQQQRLMALQDMMLPMPMATMPAAPAPALLRPMAFSVPVAVPLPAPATPAGTALSPSTNSSGQQSVAVPKNEKHKQVVRFAGQDQRLTVRSFC